MPVPSLIEKLAKDLEKSIGKGSHATVSVADLLRKLSIANKEKRIATLAQIEQGLLDKHGVACYPRLDDEPTPYNVRLYRVGTWAHHLMKEIAEPSRLDDVDLADQIKKIKGVWDWHCCADSGLRPNWSTTSGDDMSSAAG
jgi:hypothetical protein